MMPLITHAHLSSHLFLHFMFYLWIFLHLTNVLGMVSVSDQIGFFFSNIEALHDHVTAAMLKGSTF